MTTNQEIVWMSEALKLAALGRFTSDPNPNVGCIIVKDDQIVGRGWHRKAGEPHAEVYALKEAGDSAHGATVYVTLEPCNHHGKTPPCTQALIDAKIMRVVICCQDPNPKVSGKGIKLLQQAGIETTLGLLEPQSQALNRGFFKRMTTGSPWVSAKTAASIDGRTALASGQSQWITDAAARNDVQQWRAQASAILTGSGTVLADNPALNVRLDNVERQPLRVLLDTNLSVSCDARFFDSSDQTLVYTQSDDAGLHQRFSDSGIEVVRFNSGKSTIDLNAVLQDLGEREINEVWVEAGATLSGSFLDHKLVDELIIYLAPSLLGASSRGMFQLTNLESLGDAMSLKWKDIRQLGDDLRVIATPIYSNQQQ